MAEVDSASAAIQVALTHRRAQGIANRMNPEFYERPPAEGEVVMGDVM